MASFASYSGLALQIRQADNNETIDLDGSSLSTVESNFTSAFSEPFPHAASVPRITFIVGGGKLCRGKYHADTFKVRKRPSLKLRSLFNPLSPLFTNLCRPWPLPSAPPGT